MWFIFILLLFHNKTYYLCHFHIPLPLYGLYWYDCICMNVSSGYPENIHLYHVCNISVIYSKVKFARKHVPKCVYLYLCLRKWAASASLPNWVIGCLLTMEIVFWKRTVSASSVELFTWKSPDGASLTNTHDHRQQNMECIPDPEQGLL